MTITPTPAAPQLASGADTGSSATDDITSDASPAFMGSAAAGAVVTVYDTDGTVIGSGTAGSTGLYAINVTTGLDDGTHRFTVTAQVAGDDVSAASAPLTVVIDTAAPDAPTAPVLSPGSDTGASRIDGITADPTLTLSGQSEPGAAIALFDNGGVQPIATATVDADGDYTLVTGALAAGAHAFTVTATDVAGNISKPSGPTAVTIITTPPPTPAAPTLAPGSDAGVTHSDGLTNDQTPVVIGTAQAGATVQLSDDRGDMLGKAVANADGSYAITTSILSDGAYALTVTATDAAGNVSAPSAPLNVEIDTKPATATITAASVPDGAGSVVFTVNFDQPLDRQHPLNASDFKLVTTGTAAGTIEDNFSGSGQTGYVTVDGLGGAGTVALEFSNSAGFTDYAGNPVTLTATTSHNVAGTNAPVTYAISDSPTDTAGTGRDPSVNGLGTLVAFDSTDTDLAPGDTTAGDSNIYITNTQTGGVSLITAGADGNSYDPDITPKETAIVFASDATNLIPGGTPAGQTNVYVAQLEPTSLGSGAGVGVVPGSITLVSAGNGASGGVDDDTGLDGLFNNAPLISADGSTVVFASTADLVAGVNDPNNDIYNTYAYDVATGDLTLVSASSSGTPGNDTSVPTGISGDGTEIAFSTYASNIGPTPPVNFSERSFVLNKNTNTYLLLSGTQPAVGETTIGTGGASLSEAGGSVIYTASKAYGQAVVYLDDNGVQQAISSYATDYDASGEGSLDHFGDLATYVQNIDGPDGSATPDSIVLIDTANGATTPVAQGLQDQISDAGDAVVYSVPLDDGGSAVYETTLGVTESINPIGVTDYINAAQLAALTTAGTFTISGETNAADGSRVVSVIIDPNADQSDTYDGAVSNGVWTITLPASVLDGDGHYTAVVKIQTPTGDAQDSRQFVVNTTSFAAPAAPKLDPGSDTGPAHNGLFTDTATPTLTGTAVADAEITLIDQGGPTPVVLGTTTADENGVWVITSAALAKGAHALVVTQGGASGQVSPASDPLDLTVQTLTPDRPGAPAVTDATAAANPSGDGEIIASTTPTLAGSAAPGATVTLYDSDGVATLGTTVANAKGQYSITASALSDGEHKLTVTATDAAGNVSAASAALDLTIDTLPPLQPVITQLGGVLTANGQHSAIVDVEGTAEPGSTVQLHVDGDNVVAGTATTDAEGDYDITSNPLASGAHKLTVIATDAAGNASQPSVLANVTIASLPPVTTPPGSTPLIGHVSDGEISGATVFSDPNGTGVYVYGDPAAITDLNGQFTLYPGPGPLVASGGVDTATGLELAGDLVAPAGSAAITGLTTVLYDYDQETGASGDGTPPAVLTALGLAAGTDLASTDPAANASASTPDYSAMIVTGQLDDTAQQIAAVVAALDPDLQTVATAQMEGFGVKFSEIAQEIAAGGFNIGALQTTAGVDTLLTEAAATVDSGVTLSAASADAISEVIAAGNADIANAVSLDANDPVGWIDGVETLEQSQAAPELGLVALDPSKANYAESTYTGTGLASALANDVVSVTLVPFTLAPGSDTGVSDHDDITADNTPVVVGTALPGSTVTLVSVAPGSGYDTSYTYDGQVDQVFGSAAADASGHYSIASAPLAAQQGLTDVRLAVVQGTINGAVVVAGAPLPISFPYQVVNELSVRDDTPGPTIEMVGDLPGPGSDAGDARLAVQFDSYYSGAEVYCYNVYADGGSTPIGTILGDQDGAQEGGRAVIDTSALSAGPHVLTVSATLVDGIVVQGPSFDTTVTPETMATSSVATGGIIGGADILDSIDSAFNTVTTPDAAGQFQFPTTVQQVLVNGWDAATGQPFYGALNDVAGAVSYDNDGAAIADVANPLSLSAPAGSSTISPLTTLILGVIDSSANAYNRYTQDSPATAESLTLAALGLPANLDLLSLNPLTAAEVGQPAALIANAQVFDTATLLGSAGGEAAYQVIANYILNHGSIDFTNPTDIQALLNYTGISSANKADVASVIAASNAALAALATDSTPALISGVLATESLAQNAETSALNAADNASDQTDAAQGLVSAYTGSALSAQVQSVLGSYAQVTGFTADGPATSSASSVTFTVQFSQAVTGITAGQFSVIAGGDLTGVQVTGVSVTPGRGGDADDVTVGTGAGQGPLSLQFNGAGVQNAEGAPLTDGDFEPGVTYGDYVLGNVYNTDGNFAVGDFNGDGRPDIVESGSLLRVFLDQSDGTLAPQTAFPGFAAGTALISTNVAVGDFTKDGKLDILSLNEGSDYTSESLSVLPGNGDGAFQQPIETPVGTNTSPLGYNGLAVGDLNGDGDLDAVVAVDAGLAIMLGDGNGSFHAGPTLALPTEPSAIALTDLNGDGKLDLIVAYKFQSQNQISIFMGNGDGSFTSGPAVALAAGDYLNSFAVGDVNADGIPDLVVGVAGGSVDVLLGQGGGVFAAPTVIPLPRDSLGNAISPNSIVIGDVNNDGKADIVVTSNAGDQVLLGDGKGNSTLGYSTRINTGGVDAALADLNGDGRADIVAAAGEVGDNGPVVQLNEPQIVVPATSSAVDIVRPTLADPGFSAASGQATLTQTGQAYTLNLGTLSQGQAAQAVELTLANLAASGSDAFDGVLDSQSGSGFTVSGDSLPDALQAGQSYDGLSFTADTSTTGAHSETFTFAPRDVSVTTTTFTDNVDDTGTDTGANTALSTVSTTAPRTDAVRSAATPAASSAVAQELPALTLTVIDTVTPATAAPPGPAALQAPASVTLANVRVGSSDTSAVSITNSATAPADALDVTASAAGAATASGSISRLAAGNTDATDLVAGLDTSKAGAISGTLTLSPSSDDGAGDVTALPTAQVAVSGSVFRTASASVAPVSVILHVGDPGDVALTVDNTAAADGYSENLVATATGGSGTASVDGVTRNVAFGTSNGGSTGEIAAGSSGAIEAVVPTTTAGTITGTVDLGLVSDGGTGSGGIDGLGQQALASVNVPVSVTVDNYAQATLAASGATLTAGATPNSYVLNLGTVDVGAAPLTADLDTLNSATGPADDLGGTYTLSGDPQFTNAGFSGFSNDAAGASDPGGVISLATNKAGTFKETLTLTPTDTNAGGYDANLAAQTVTITGTVAPAVGSGFGDVHMVTFDGLSYAFQADGDFVLTQSKTNPGFAIQIQTSPWAYDQATSLTTGLAARVGGDVVQFTANASPLVSIDGVADASLGVGDSQSLADGTLTRSSADSYTLDWNTGETLTVTDQGYYLDESVQLGSGDLPGSVQGLLGADEGQAEDLQLPDGTVLPQPVATAVLLGAYASAWSVTPQTSLLSPTVITGETGGDVLQGGPEADIITASGAGQTLAGGGGDDVLIGSSAGGDTFKDTAANLGQATIQTFGETGDAIDAIDVAYAGQAPSFVEDASNTFGTLTIGSGASLTKLILFGQFLASDFQASNDGGAGTLISYAAPPSPLVAAHG